MAGHSKWANIQHRKNAQDAKRGKLFTKLIREITTAARIGGGDAATNPRLRTAIDKALAANMTRDTIERATQRGTGDLEGVSYEEMRYEGYGPGGVADLALAPRDAGAEDIVEHDDGSREVLTAPEDFETVRDALVAARFEPDAAETTMRASTSVSLAGDDAATMMKLIDLLEDLDDVQDVYSNADIADEVLASL